MCAFSDLLTNMQNLKTFTLSTSMNRHPMTYSGHDRPKDWSLILRILLRARSLQGMEIVLNIRLYCVYLIRDEDMMNFVMFIENFAAITISQLFIEVGFSTQRESFPKAILQSLQSFKHIKKVHLDVSGHESMLSLAAHLPTSVLQLTGPNRWSTPMKSAALSFPHLRSIEVDCRDDSSAILQILSFLHAPKLRTICLMGVDSSNSASILGEDFNLCLRRYSDLETIKIHLLSSEAPWSVVQTRLEDLRLYVTALGKRLKLEIECWGISDGCHLALSWNGQAVPLSEPLQGHIEEIFCLFDEDCRQPMYRADRVRLPSVRKLTLGLMECPVGLLQWYLDGLDLPNLIRFTVILGCGPRVFQVFLAYIPLLPSCCLIRLQYAEEWHPDKVKAFRRSDDFSELKRTCSSLGIDLQFEGRFWSLPL